MKQMKKMKERIGGAAVCGLTLLAACHSAPADLSGRLAELESDTLWIVSSPLIDNSNVRIDTLAVGKDGRFALTYGDGMLRNVYIWGQPAGASPEGRVRIASLLLLPGRPVSVEGTPESNVMRGDSFYVDCSMLNQELRPYYDRLDSLAGRAARLSAEGAPADSISRTYAPVRSLLDGMASVRMDYVRRHPGKDAALYALTSDVPIDSVAPLLARLAPEVRSGWLAPLCRHLQEGYDKELRRRSAAERIQAGKPAPEFALADRDGNRLALASLRGKYVVIDFWGSWCGWCVKEFPDMKKAYESCKGRVEFLGIACRDTEEKWRAAVEEYRLPWLQVINGAEGTAEDVAMLYGVRAYPTKVVVDPQGRIAKVFVGNTPEFYEWLRDNG